MSIFRTFTSRAVALWIISVGTTAHAVDFEWIGPGDGAWPNPANWNQIVFPDALDRILLTDESTSGSISIDLAGPQGISSIEANGVDGTYTFTNTGSGALSIFRNSGEAILHRSGGDLVFDADILLHAANTLRFNVQPTGGKITVHGNVASAAAAGVTELMLTSASALSLAVDVSGNISDGTAGAQLSLAAGFNGNTAHTGTVRVTGSNTYTGTTRVYIGTLEFDSIANVGGGPNALGQPSAGSGSVIRLGSAAVGQSSAALRYLGAGDASDRGISLVGRTADSARIESSGSGALVLNGPIVNEANNQTLVLGGTYGGGNSLAGSMIAGGGAGNVLNLSKEGDGLWILAGDSPRFNGGIVAGDGRLVLSGKIGSETSNAGLLIVLNAGAFTLDGGYLAVSDLNKSAVGAFDFDSGTVRVTNASEALDFMGPVVIGSQGAGTLILERGSKSFDEVRLQGPDDALVLGGNGTWRFDNLDNSAGGTIEALGGKIDLKGPGRFTHRIDSGVRQIGSEITNGGLTKQGAGALELTFPGQHTYAGRTRIEEGRLRLVGASGFADIAPVFIAAGATLDLVDAVGGDGFGFLTGSGTILTAEERGVVINTNGNDAYFDGSITGAGPLGKSGAGVQILGGANAYTGPTELTSNGGTLEVAAGGSISGTSGVTIRSATLRVSGGALQTAGDIRALHATSTIEISGGLVAANSINRVNTAPNPDAYLGTLNWTGGEVRLRTATEISGGAAEVRKPFGAALELTNGKDLVIDDTLTIGSGGTLTLADGTAVTDDLLVVGGTIHFDAGTIRLRNDQVLDHATLAALDAQVPLVANQSLVIDGMATIAAPLVLAGGTFTAGSIVGAENLILSSGTLEVTASDLAVASGETLDATSGVTIHVTNGALAVEPGGQFNAINATLAISDGIVNHGDVNLINSLVHGNLINATGGSANLLGSNSFGDDLALSAGSTLFLELGGTQPGRFDQVTIGGNANLAGTLSISLAADYALTVGDSFEIVDIEGLQGGLFAGLADDSLVGVYDGIGLFIDYDGGDGNDIVLTTLASPNVDLDGDGDVDGADFLAIQRTEPTLLAAWESRFGLQPSIATATTPVPEPGTAGWLLAMWLGFVGRMAYVRSGAGRRSSRSGSRGARGRGA